MTAVPIEVTEDGIRIGEAPSHPDSVGVVEARGGLLYFDELPDRRYPSATLHDPELAADWLWEVYGHAAAATALSGGPTIEPDGEPVVTTALRTLAHLNWARSWWPTSTIAAVPRLSANLVRAEAAIATATVEHLLDDPLAVVRSLSGVDIGRLRHRPDREPFAEAVSALAEDVERLAEDYGVTVTATAERPAATRLALAAGGESATDGVVLWSGSDGIDWSLLRPRQLDAAATVEWTIARHRGQTLLSASVPAVSGPWRDRGRLRARLGDAEVTVTQAPDSRVYFGSGPVPDAVLRLPGPRRRLVVYSPDQVGPASVAVPTPETLRRQQALIAHARTRLAAPEATLAERVAARSAP